MNGVDDVTDLPDSEHAPKIKVEDRRFWARPEESDEEAGEENAPTPDPELDAFRLRAEAAEAKLREYATAVDRWKQEQEQLRARLERDLESRLRTRFGDLVADLLESVDDLDLAVAHARGVSEGSPFVEGITLVRDRFVSTLARHGVERLDLDGTPFDPNVAEAVAVEPSGDPAADGCVVRTVRSGYRYGDRIVRAARVAVGRATP